MGFFCCLQWQTPFARAALLSFPRTVRNGDLPSQSPAPSTWTHGAQGVGAFPSTLSSDQEWEQRREWHSFRLSPGRELEVVMFSSLWPSWLSALLCRWSCRGDYLGDRAGKEEEPNRNGGCGCASVGCVSFCLSFRLWKRHRRTPILLLSPHSSQTFLLAGCSGHLLQKFPIWCRMRIKGWFALAFSFC